METTWDKKRSQWYCRSVEQSDYPERTVAALSPLLRKCDSVLDIGAGCGALAIPIAGRVREVTAVEPSRWMYGLLLKRMKDADRTNIRTYRWGWKGNGPGGGFHRKLKRHDMVLCANLPHRLACNVRFLRHVSEASKKLIVFIQNAGGWNRFYYKELYPLLLGKKYRMESDFIRTYSFLHRHSIIANVKIFEYSLDQPFEDFQEAVEFWRHRLGITLSPRKKRTLERFLRKRLVLSGRRAFPFVAPFGTRRAALMWWTA